MKIKLFVFDFDGTALGGHTPYDQFPQPFVEFLDGLDRFGVRWATNTTWHTDAQHKVLKRSRVKSDAVFLAGGTGTLMATMRNGIMTHDTRYERQVRQRQKQFHIQHWPMIQNMFEALLTSNLVDGFAYNTPCPQCMISFTCRQRNTDKAWSLLAPLLDCKTYYALDRQRTDAGGWLLPYFMNKGAVIKIMQQRLGIGAAETLVAGDGFNDRHMMTPEIAHWAVCPGNADPRIKAAVRAMGGVVARKFYSQGVIEGVLKMLRVA